MFIAGITKLEFIINLEDVYNKMIGGYCIISQSLSYRYGCWFWKVLYLL